MRPDILVAFDDSEPSRRALKHAIENFPEADITVLTVVGEVGAVNDADDVSPEEDPEGFSEVAQERLTAAKEIAAERGVSIRTDCEVGPPCEKIPEYAEDEGFDHIVMGSHGRTGISRLVVGSVSENVSRNASSPVTTVQ